MFLDTSALAKLYHRELGTDVMEALTGRRQSIYVSRLAVVEMQSVFSGKVRTGQLAQSAADLLRRRFRGELHRRRFQTVALRSHHYQTADLLIVRHGPNGLRTLDSLQLAVALDLFRNGLVSRFVTADRVLSKVAALEGLPVINPETHP